jgi:AcrR family transcriptional regulator
LRGGLLTPRTYNSPRREAEAAETRTRILDASATLFIRDGYSATPLRAIAEEAGVSLQSVNLAGPKSALLLAAFERAFAGTEGSESLSERPEMREIIATPDPDAAIELYIAFLATANERAAAIWAAFMAAADADPAVRETAAALEARRMDDMRLGAGFFVQRGLISPDRLDDAADVLGFLTSAPTYLYFVEQRGWPRARYEAWLRRALERLLLHP